LSETLSGGRHISFEFQMTSHNNAQKIILEKITLKNMMMTIMMIVVVYARS